MRWHAVDEKERFNVVDVPASPQEYVRADVAAAKAEAARAQSKEGWKSFGEAMALVQAEADEKHALRAEVEALRGEREVLRRFVDAVADGATRNVVLGAQFTIAEVEKLAAAKGVG